MYRRRSIGVDQQPLPIATAPLFHSVWDAGMEESRRTRRRYARNGAMIGSIVGLLAVWQIMSWIDPTPGLSHKSIWPIAVLFLTSVAGGAFFVCVLLGLIIGWLMGLPENGFNDEQSAIPAEPDRP